MSTVTASSIAQPISEEKGPIRRTKSTHENWDNAWLDGMGNQTVREDFQAFIIQVDRFSQQFRKQKYAEHFLTMADPCEALLDLITASHPPEDVLVATLSGSLKTILNQIILKKSGKAKVKQFGEATNNTNNALQKFVHSLQSAIRKYEYNPEKQERIENSPRSALTHLETVDELRIRIKRLRQPPCKRTFKDNCKHALFSDPILMILGILCYGLGIGALGCSSWYKVERRLWAWVGPFTFIGIGTILILKSYFANLERNDWGKYGRESGYHFGTPPSTPLTLSPKSSVKIFNLSGARTNRNSSHYQVLPG